MAGKVTARIPAGMRDILPAQMIKRQYVIDVIRRVFEEFGFEPLQTSAIELTETLTGKYGEDAERLIYKAWYGDTPGDEFSLRYDLSVPLCRVVSMYADQLPQPFKRYQIAPVWRADRPQKGRYREFFQCDADVVGTTSMLADAEVVAVTATVLQRLGFTNFTVSINSRKVLAGIGEYAGVPESLRAGLYRSIDKLDKIGIEGVRRELLMVGVPQDYIPAIQRVARLAIQKKVDPGAIGEALAAPGDGGATGVDPRLAALIAPRLKGLAEKVLTEGFNPGKLQALTLNMAGELAPELRAFYGEAVDAIPVEVVDRMLDLLQVSGRNDEVLGSLLERLQGIPIAEEGIRDLQEMARYLAALGIPEQAYAINFAMVRGLEYYTGPIFETTITEPRAMPSITGGGRFDKLISMFGAADYPAVGTSFGIERIIDAMDELGMFPPEIRPTTAQVLVTVFSTETVEGSVAAARLLRAGGIATSVYYDYTHRLGDQIGYASSKGIPFVAILGPDELAAGRVTIRKLGQTRSDSEQRTFTLTELPAGLRAWIQGIST